MTTRLFKSTHAYCGNGRFRTFGIAAACMLAVAACAGCINTTLPEPPMVRADKPLAAKALIYVQSMLGTSLDAASDSCTLPVDELQARWGLVSPILGLELFAVTGSIDPAEVPPERLLDHCKADGADFLLHFKITGHRISYLGTNAWLWPNIFVWMCTWIASYWVPDEKFTADIQVDAEVRDVRTGRSAFSKNLKVTGMRNLNDFNRGWSPLVLICPSFDEDNFREAAVHLDRDLWPRVRSEVTGAFSKEFTETLNAGGWKPPSANRALVVGIGPESCLKDADAMAAFLLDKAGYAKENVMVLKAAAAGGTRATKDAFAAFDSMLKEWARLAFADRDTALVYFAGTGASKSSGLSLAFGGENAADLAEVVPILDRFRSSALLLDCGFNPKGMGRSLASSAGLMDASWLSRTVSGRNVMVFAAASAGGQAVEEEGRGVFTRALIRGLEGRADMDGDGITSIDEIAKYVASEIQGYAAMMGARAEPFFKAPAGSWMPFFRAQGGKRK